jgi:hypothetical protein
MAYKVSGSFEMAANNATSGFATSVNLDLGSTAQEEPERARLRFRGQQQRPEARRQTTGH